MKLDLGGIRAVFDPLTGETHFLSDLPLILLDEVGSGPATAERLFMDVFGEEISEIDRSDLDKVVAAMGSLVSAELLEANPPGIV